MTREVTKKEWNNIDGVYVLQPLGRRLAQSGDFTQKAWDVKKTMAVYECKDFLKLNKT